MKPGMEVGLRPGNIVFEGNPALLPKRAQIPVSFWPMSVVAKQLVD